VDKDKEPSSNPVWWKRTGQVFAGCRRNFNSKSVAAIAFTDCNVNVAAAIEFGGWPLISVGAEELAKRDFSSDRNH
jgi:hypothetical protein